VRGWWRRHGEGVEEDLRKVAYLQGQLDAAVQSLSSSLDELRQIFEDPPAEEESQDA
jgi:hypothetical protein